RSTADAVYLNELYRARVERAGAVYIDVWDGFVDEEGKYATYGPDYEGQVRRLRAADGVFFTKYGARKLAHYVEREIRRYMSNRGPIALPSGPMGPVPADGTVARPLAGPVVPLTMTTSNSDESLAGGGGAQIRDEASAAKVLVKGDAVTAPIGRADDFAWPQGSDAKAAADKPGTGKAAVDKAPANKASSNKASSDKAAVAKPAALTQGASAPGALAPVQAAPAKSTSSQPRLDKSTSASKPASTSAAASAAAPEIAAPDAIIAPEPGIAKPEPAVAAKPAAEKPAKSVAEKPRRQTESAPRPARRSSDGLFGANGPFGWMR
ncbi:MAG: hypothetical protein B7Y71_01360, partial [Xanthobacter sp. 35-67-6]